MYLVPKLRNDEMLMYLRKSQTDDPLLSVHEILAKHEQMLDDWVSMNMPEAGAITEDNKLREIASGETIAARPAMQELLKLVESPKIKAILVTEPSRLTRGSLKEIGHIVEILRYSNTIVITLQYAYDLTDERDRDLFERELMRGNEYLEYTKKIRLNGRIASCKAGNYIHEKAPYGYRKVVYKEGRRSVHTLEPDPEQAQVVKRIFELYVGGMGTTKIAKLLDSEHIQAPTSKGWSPDGLPALLNNVHYLGKVKWNARKSVRTVADGEVKVSRPRAEDYLIFEGKHPAIIEQELWDRVQAIKGTHTKEHATKPLVNPLAGILYCTCGRAMVARPYRDKNGQERCAPRVLCGDRKNYCRTASARLPDVVDEVIKVLEATLEEFEEQINNNLDDGIEEHKKMIARMEHRLDELRKLEVQQWSEKMNSKMPEHVFKALNDPTVAEIENLELALHEAKHSIPEPVDIQNKIVTLKSTIDLLRDNDAPATAKNRLLKKCVEHITYSREKYTTFGTPKGMVENPFYLDIKLKL